MYSRLIVPYVKPRPAGRGDLFGAKHQPEDEQKKTPDNQVERVIKYVPTEIISGYLALSGLATALPENLAYKPILAWGLVVIGLIFTPLYLMKSKPQGKQWWQIPISTAAFFFWAYALGGPFTRGTPWIEGWGYNGAAAAIVAGAFGWVASRWVPVEDSVAANDSDHDKDHNPKNKPDHDHDHSDQA